MHGETTLTSQPHAAAITEADLPALTVGLAYVLPMVDEDEERVYYGIFDDQGRPLALATTRELAFLAIRRNDLEPVDAH